MTRRPSIAAGATAAYIRDLRSIPARLSREEQFDAARRYRAGDKRAGQRLVESILPLALKLAAEHRVGHVPFDDLVQQANLGACVALDKYDPAHGVLFTSYAAFWIRAYLLNFLRDGSRVLHVLTTKRDRKAYFDIVKRDGKNTDPELAASVRAQMAPTVTLDSLALQGCEVADDSPTAEERCAEHEEQTLIRRAIRRWRLTRTPRERDLYDRRLAAEAPKTLAEIAARWGVSRERVRQIENRMLDELREHFASEGAR